MEETNKKVALITGITGQDGSFLAEFLLEKGYEKEADMSFIPGRYIKNHVKEIIDRINNELCIEQKPIEKPKNEGRLVKVTCKCLNIRKEPSAKSKKMGEITDGGVYTIIEESSGWGKLKSGVGWICLKYTKGV